MIPIVVGDVGRGLGDGERRMTAELAAISGVGTSVGVAGAGDGSGGDGVQVVTTGTAVAVGDVVSLSSAEG